MKIRKTDWGYYQVVGRNWFFQKWKVIGGLLNICGWEHEYQAKAAMKEYKENEINNKKPII